MACDGYLMLKRSVDKQSYIGLFEGKKVVVNKERSRGLYKQLCTLSRCVWRNEVTHNDHLGTLIEQLLHYKLHSYLAIPRRERDCDCLDHVTIFLNKAAKARFHNTDFLLGSLISCITECLERCRQLQTLVKTEHHIKELPYIGTEELLSCVRER